MTKKEFDTLMGRETQKEEFLDAMNCYRWQELLDEKEFFELYKNDPRKLLNQFASTVYALKADLENLKEETVNWVEGLGADVMKKALEFVRLYPAGRAATIKEKLRNCVDLEEEELNYVEDNLK